MSLGNVTGKLNKKCGLNTLSLQKSFLEELTWKEVSKAIEQLDPELFEAIEASALPANLKLFKVSYPYGAQIMKDGLVYLPNADGALVPLADESIPAITRRHLDYNHYSNPASFILKGSADLFLTHRDVIFSFPGPVPAGRLFGTSLVLTEGRDVQKFHPTFLWQMTAGVRSLILLPKMGDAAGLDRLDRHFKINSRSLVSEGRDSWFLFRELAQKLDKSDFWTVEILFFSGDWFKWDNKPTSPFKELLFKRAWKITEFWRNEYLWNMVFSIFMDEKIVRINPFIGDTVKHLMYMAVGAQPGFAPSNNVDFAPIPAFQKTLKEVYQIDYEPIFMLPQTFQKNCPQPVYYSLAYPNTMEFSPSTKKISTKANDLEEILLCMKKYLHFLKTSDLNIQDSAVYEMAQKVAFSFYHPSHEDNNIQKTEALFDQDGSFKAATNVKKINLPLPKNATFFKGCVKITLEES